MRKLLGVMALLAIGLSVKPQPPAKIIHANQLTSKPCTIKAWSANWEFTDAVFMFYKVQGVMKTIDAFFDPSSDFKVPLTFFVYEETRTIEHDDRCYYLIAYTAGQEGTNKQYDRSQYFKITTQKNGITTIRLYNYQNTDWEWIVDSVSK